MPDLDELTGFDPGHTAPTLPPSEIRRRGDRRRRRRTALLTAGGAAAVALAVGVPVLTLTGGDHRGPQPAPAPAPATGWVTAVPTDFPLTVGFPQPWDDARKGVVPGCGGWDPAYVDERVVVADTGGDVRAQRMLLLFADDASAHDALAALARATGGCAPVTLPGGSRTVVDPVVLEADDRSGDESYAFRQVTRDGTRTPATLSDLTVVEVSRTGNALYLDSARTTDGDDGVLSSQVVDLARGSRVPLAAMCAFSASPCVSTGTPTAGPHDIADDLPLAVGFTTGPGESVTGPDRGINGVSLAEACDTTAWPATGGTDRIAVRLDGVGRQVVRELVTFPDAAAASDALQRVRDAAYACSSDGRRVFLELPADTGYADVTFAYRPLGEPTAGTVYQFVQVGRAVLATSTSGDDTGAALEATADQVTTANQQVTAALACDVTDAGC